MGVIVNLHLAQMLTEWWRGGRMQGYLIMSFLKRWALPWQWYMLEMPWTVLVLELQFLW